ncbi:MAG: hypothetical protein JSS60_03975 [Verrucomicrobia bacterium]|nr:hypothetical protein [Verrucomicrobiota bacterium]
MSSGNPFRLATNNEPGNILKRKIKMKKTILAVLILASSSVFAALPPLAQSNREIQAILQSPETYRLLGGADPIDQIIRSENGYLLITRKTELLVDISYLHTGKIGPAEFELHFHSPVAAE